VTHEAFLAPFADHFRAQGWRVDGMSAELTGSPAARHYDAVFDAAWSRNPLDVSNLWRAAPQIRAVVQAGGYDIVHVHTPVAAFVTRFALRRMRGQGKVHVIYTAHGFHFAEGLGRLRNATFLALERIAGRWTDALVVINAEDFAAAQRHHIVPVDRLRLIHGIGVDTDHFAPGQVPSDAVQRVRDEIGVNDAPLVLMVAEFTPNKRHSAVLRAFALARSGAHLAFAGDGPTRADAERLARDLGVGERVHFLGQRGDVRELIGSSVATVLFSEREGLPRSSMESLSMGVPVVGSDIRGLRDLLEDGCGILVARDDERSLAAAIDEVVAVPEWAHEMGQRGRAKMLGEFSLAAVLAQHEYLYGDVLASDR